MVTILWRLVTATFGTGSDYKVDITITSGAISNGQVGIMVIGNHGNPVGQKMSSYDDVIKWKHRSSGQ